jgi:hypothetical protein
MSAVARLPRQAAPSDTWPRHGRSAAAPRRSGPSCSARSRWPAAPGSSPETSIFGCHNFLKTSTAPRAAAAAEENQRAKSGAGAGGCRLPRGRGSWCWPGTVVVADSGAGAWWAWEVEAGTREAAVAAARSGWSGLDLIFFFLSHIYRGGGAFPQ